MAKCRKLQSGTEPSAEYFIPAVSKLRETESSGIRQLLEACHKDRLSPQLHRLGDNTSLWSTILDDNGVVESCFTFHIAVMHVAPQVASIGKYN